MSAQFWTWFGDGANIIQWLSFPGMVIAAAAYWHASCDQAWWCWRPGRVDVEGTTWRVCANHSTPHHHALLQRLHRHKHTERTS